MWAQPLTSPGSFSLVEVPDAGLDSGDTDHVLIEVLAGGICGSDLPLFRGITPLNRASLVGAPVILSMS